MRSYIVLIGSVTAKQYQQFRLEELHKGNSPKVIRVAWKDFKLNDGVSGKDEVFGANPELGTEAVLELMSQPAGRVTHLLIGTDAEDEWDADSLIGTLRRVEERSPLTMIQIFRHDQLRSFDIMLDPDQLGC